MFDVYGCNVGLFVLGLSMDTLKVPLRVYRGF